MVRSLNIQRLGIKTPDQAPYPPFCVPFEGASSAWDSVTPCLLSAGAKGGIPSEADYVAAYCRRAGREGIAEWDFYLAFSMFRLASISQGVYKRGLDGNASSENATQYGSACRMLAECAWSQVAQRA